MRIVRIILFWALAFLLDYAESSLPPSGNTGNNIPLPVEGVLPPRYFILDGALRELNRPNAHPLVVNGYFLGMQDGRYLFPIFNDDPYRVYSFRHHRLVHITAYERRRLLEGLPLASGPPRSHQR